jgi:hypothetical protein
MLKLQVEENHGEEFYFMDLLVQVNIEKLLLSTTLLIASYANKIKIK